MAACPELLQCGLHRSISMKEALRVWQSFYCEGAYRRCERFKLATSGLKVPEKLLPNGRLVADLDDQERRPASDLPVLPTR